MKHVSSKSEARVWAERYLGGSRNIVDETGWGTDGWVFSLRPHSVVKVHRGEASFWAELRAYQRLAYYGVTEINGCNVPQLRNHDEEHLTIEISYVTPPYVIDFGKSYLDKPRDFSPELWADWERKIEYMYGSNAEWALRIHRTLSEKYGIYHDDVRPVNINLGDYPDDDDDQDDDFDL